MDGSAAAMGEGARMPQPAPRRRRGRPEREAGESQVAQELRRRRQALRLTVRQAAERCGVSPGMLSEIETGRRLPAVATWARLRRGLAIEAPLSILTRAAPPVEVLETHLVRLAACLLGSGGRARLPDLGSALGLPATAVREQLPLVAPRLAGCGYQLATDGLEVRLDALEVAEAPLRTLGNVVGERRRRALTEEAQLVLVYVGWHGEVTRQEIERFRGDDSETLLGSLVDSDLLAAVRDDRGRGRPLRYRLSVAGLRTLGAASPEELRDKLHPTLGALVDGEGEDAPPLPDQLTVLTLAAGLGEAGTTLIAHGLGKTEQECAVLLEQMVRQGMLTVTSGADGPRYGLGPAGLRALGSDGVEALRRAAWVAGFGEEPSSAATAEAVAGAG